jgi:threonine aldolase
MAISRHAIARARQLKAILQEKGFRLYLDSPTNQQFVVIANELAERLSRKVAFSHFGQTDHHHTICRFVTSWATTEEEIDFLEQLV